MRRILAITLSSLLLLCIVLGCGQPAAQNADKKIVEIDPDIVVAPPVKKKIDEGKKPIDVPIQLVGNPGDDKQAKYDAAIAEALTALAERKFDDALAAYEMARSIQDTEFVQSEIKTLKERIDQDDAAKSTVKNIETVLSEGKAEDAIKLTNIAIKEFGAGDDAPTLIQLRLQADALADVQKNEPVDARYKRYRSEGEAALGEKNLRAAALAFEQALLARADGDLQKTYEAIRGKLDRYDAQRKKAAELRRDPTQLEDALAALKDAAEAWDTLQLRTETDELMLALAKRRASVSVADFEMHRDLAMPDAGAALADEILPRLKAKFDLVERSQLKRVIDELKLEEGFADDPAQQKQLAQLAKVRYLVVGNIRQIGSLIIHARLVDVQTGLVVQTGKITAATMEEALNQAPELAKQLLMNDEEKLAYDAEVLAHVVKKVEVVTANAELPPAPLPPMADAPPAKLAFDPPPPPALGDVNPKLFEKFAPPPAEVVAPPADLPSAVMQQRLLFATLELGDNHFRAGRYLDAQRQFEFALTLAPNNFDIRLRLERVRPLLLPVVIVQQPGYFARPRLALLPFVNVGNPNLIPSSLSTWTPAQLAPYFASRYDVVDPAQIYWYMGRMGLSLRDIMDDPVARRWLSRAVGVRYFVFGNHIETASFDVNTYLIDAESGYLVGSGRVHVQNRFDLRLRLPELASVTLMTPGERNIYFAVKGQQQFDQLVQLGRRHMDQRKYHLAVDNFTAALQLRPNVGQVRYWLVEARDKARWHDFELARQRQYATQQAILAAQHQRQLDLAHAAEAARRHAIADAAARDEAARRAQLTLRFQAQQNLVAQAQVALKTKNFSISVSLFQGATHMVPANVVSPLPAPPPTTVMYQDFAAARIAAERAARARDAQLIAAREAAQRQERERQLLAAQQQLAQERKQAANALHAQREAQLARDAAAYSDSIKQGQHFMTQRKYEAALAAFQGAQRLAHSAKEREDVNRYLEEIVKRQAVALAKTQAEKTQVEQKLEQERIRLKTAEAAAKQNEENYKAALSLAQQALQQKNYDAAQKKFEAAARFHKTDAVALGLRQVEAGRSALLAQQKKSAADAQKAERIKQWMSEGNAALNAKKFNEAVAAFQQAKKLAPESVEVVSGLTRAEQMRAQLQTEASRQAEESARTQNFQHLLKSGQANLASKQYEAAVASLSEAVKLNPKNADALTALKQAQKARDASITDAKSDLAAKARAAAYQKHLQDGQRALSSKRYADAIKAFNDAQQVLPGDKTSLGLLQEAQTAKKSAEDALAKATKQRDNDLKKGSDLKAALTQARLALSANDLAKAGKLLQQAKAIDPKDADVLRALRDLDQANQRLSAEAEAQKKRQQQFQTLLDIGKAALTTKRYPDAVKAFSSATTLFPQDKEAQQLFQRAKTEAKSAEDASAKAKVQADFQAALGAGQKAMQTKNYAAAIQSFQQALKLNPNDVGATKLLQQAQVEQGNLAKAAENFTTAMNAGNKAMSLKDYNGAIRAYTDAAKLNPGDSLARQRLAQAQQALNAANQQNAMQANYQKALSAGQGALKVKNFAEAVRSFQDALKYVPNDKSAQQQLRQAQQLWDASKIKTPPPADQKKLAYDAAMRQGASLEKSRKYGEAMKAYQEALRNRPKDAEALAGIKNNQFYNHLAVGQQRLDSAMWMAAQSEFEAALRMFPNNDNAKKLLEKAKKKMK